MTRSWRRTASLTMVTALLASTIVAFPSIASADDEVDAASIAVAAQSLANLDESLLLAASDGAGTGTVQTSQGTIGVPSRLTDGVSIHSPGRSPLTIDLPEADAAGDAVLLQGGAVTYPGESLTNSVIVGDAGVQMLTTITSADAPEHLEYDVDLGVGESLRSTEDGAAVVAADGTVLAVVADAWHSTRTATLSRRTTRSRAPRSSRSSITARRGSHTRWWRIRSGSLRGCSRASWASGSKGRRSRRPSPPARSGVASARPRSPAHWASDRRAT